ncbi:PaaI family thioesterase [Amycolatopsis sp.]|uniref:PaaI family thioesterase n=1 Tax=Amycolatopsis sp. TaxID=37632 RepID=UPI002DFB90CD|nr:PaaI family thioesterase [Amycolatopsis sp.]
MAPETVAKVPGANDFGLPEVAETPELLERRAAVAELGGELRKLIDAVVRTEVPAEAIRHAAEAVRELTGPLTEDSRPVGRPPAVDNLVGGLRMLNPVIGEGNPLAPPLVVKTTRGTAVGECTLGLAYEGPPTYGHGGISALLLDQVLGHAASSIDKPGVTTGLTLRYRRPVPLDVPIRVWAEVVAVDGRRTTVKGGITTAAEPEAQLVEAEGDFLQLRPDQAKRLLSQVPPDAAHD